MSLPTQTEGNKEGFAMIQATDATGLVYSTIGDIRIYVGTGTPHATVTAPKGSLFIELSGPDLYMNTNAITTWELVGGQS